MPTPKCKDFRGLYDNYIGEDDQTTQAELQDYHENQNTLIKEACTNFWQPLTDYPDGHIIRSSNMPAGVWAIVVKAGTSGEEEPTWDYANKSVSDGSVIWLMFYLKVTVNGIAADEEGNIELDKSDIGLDNVDNTPDSEKIVAQAGKVGNKTIGGTAQPVYIKDGIPEAFSGNIGGTAQPIYMLAGVLKALGSTIGSASKPVYIDAGVIKACSTALGASANGGIIAQSLGTNGYVKFANGLILQWGLPGNSGDNSATNIALPISFRNTSYVALVCSTTGSKASSGWDFINVKQTGSFTAVTRSNVNWIAIGKQQWGYNNTSSAATIYFPIAFPSACYSVVLGGYRQCTGNQRATSITKTSFYLGGDSASDAQYSRWMAVGSQQWGKSSSSGRATTTVTLPISMASAIYAVAISQAAASDTWSTWSSIVSNTQIKLTNNYGPGSWWLVIGKQQWGYNSNNTAGATTGFPISFASACYGVVHCSGNTGRIEGNPYISSLTKSQINWGQYGLGYWIAFGL